MTAPAKNADANLEAGNLSKTFTSHTSLPTTDASPTDLPAPRYRFDWIGKARWKVFEAYNRLNFLLVVANAAVIIAFAAHGMLISMPIETLAIPVAANIALTVLVRNEIVVNLLFMLFGCFSPRLPLRIRRMAAKIYHLGGVHSGAAISALLWYAVFNVVFLLHWVKLPTARDSNALFATTAVIDVLLVAIVGCSWPLFRQKYHNTWECIHRFGGWSAIVLFWTQFGLMVKAGRKMEEEDIPVVEMLVKKPTFWMLVVVTFCLIWPWLRLRKVDVYAEPLSSHAIRLHFMYTNIAFCAAPRLSDSPLKEWHSFAGIPEKDGIGYSVIVSRSGDWTEKIIQYPPSKLWVRSIPVRGVLHIAPLFKRIILVATGSGIGPVLSLLYARKIECRILWSTQDPEKTFQEEIVDQVMLADPKAMIINTTVSGRQDLVAEAYKLYRDMEAEAVFIISNPKLTLEAVYRLESRGIPTFAPIWDS